MKAACAVLLLAGCIPEDPKFVVVGGEQKGSKFTAIVQNQGGAGEAIITFDVFKDIGTRAQGEMLHREDRRRPFAKGESFLVEFEFDPKSVSYDGPVRWRVYALPAPK